MNVEDIKVAALNHYNENVVGEPLTESVPIDCYIKGAEFILANNKNNYKQALKSLDAIRNEMIKMCLYKEWMTIVNALRLSAGLEEITFKS